LDYDLTEHITVRYSQHKIKVLIFSMRQSAWWRNSLWYVAPTSSAIDFFSPLCADVRTSRTGQN